jgi:anti-anti-sigma factor
VQIALIAPYKENSMEIKTSTENGRVPVTIIHVEGSLDSSTSVQFQKKAAELIKGGAHHILVDLTHSPYVSSAGFRVLSQIFKDLNAIHPDSNLSETDMRKGVREGSYKSPYLKLLNLSNQPKTVFTATGFDMYIEEYDDLKKAISAF